MAGVVGAGTARRLRRLRVRRTRTLSALARAERRDADAMTAVRIAAQQAARTARTRTLIQVGGLAEKAGLLDLLKIPVGADLQAGDEDCRRQAAVLLGALA